MKPPLDRSGGENGGDFFADISTDGGTAFKKIGDVSVTRKPQSEATTNIDEERFGVHPFVLLLERRERFDLGWRGRPINCGLRSIGSFLQMY